MSQAASVGEHPVLTGLRDAAATVGPGAYRSVWQLSDTEVEAGIGALLEIEARAGSLCAALLREACGRDLKARTRAATVERWLGDRFRLSRAEAGTRLREAALHGRHPVVEAALAQGSLTLEQAGVVAAVLDQVALLAGVGEAERAAAAGFLLDQCTALGPRELARAGQAVLEALAAAPSVEDPGEAAAVEREHRRAEQDAQHRERNDLRLTRRRGRLRALLDLGPLGEATLLAWLRRAEQPHPGTDGFADHREPSERRGDALVDLLAAAATTGHLPYPTPRPQPTGDHTDRDSAHDSDRDHHSDRDEYPDHGDGPGPGTGDGGADGSAPGPVSPLALLTVTTTLAGLRAGLAGAGRLDTGGTLSAATLRQLACDALLVPAVLASPSEILDLGRTTRQWNRAQRRAAALRDRGCVAPACDRPPAACHLHHAWHWTDGGPTDLDNGALLCGFHHRMVHRQGWDITLAPNGYPQLIPPPSIDPTRRPRQHHRFRLTPLTLLTGRDRR